MHVCEAVKVNEGACVYTVLLRLGRVSTFVETFLFFIQEMPLVRQRFTTHRTPGQARNTRVNGSACLTIRYH